MSIVRKINPPTQAFSLTPRNLDEAMKYAELIANSDFCPKESRGKPGNILIAIQYGSELGISPMQSLQNISVINGRPCLWGDTLLGLVKAHPSFIDINEEVKNDIAYCRVVRKNAEPVDVTFSIEDAKKAGLWGKAGPWSQYPKRMLQMRARSFALRDAFPDVLKGLNMREEIEDITEAKQQAKKYTPLKSEKIIISEVATDDLDEVDYKSDLLRIETCNNLEELESAYKSAYKFWAEKRDATRLKGIIDAKDKVKAELEGEQQNAD